MAARPAKLPIAEPAGHENVSPSVIRFNLLAPYGSKARLRHGMEWIGMGWDGGEGEIARLRD